MAHYLNTTVESIIGIVDGGGNLQTGIVANVSANLYNPLNVLDGALVVTEIGATGRYRCDFTRNNAGAWKVLWACTDPVCAAERIFDLIIDPNVALLAAIAGIPAATDVVLSAVHGVGSWATADLCVYHVQPF